MARCTSRWCSPTAAGNCKPTCGTTSPTRSTTFEQDDFVKAKGVIHKYNGRWQMTVHKLRKLDDAEIDYSDYIPKTTQGHRRAVGEAGRVCREFRKSLAQATGASFHERRSAGDRLQVRACGQDAAPCLRRRLARPRGVAVHGVRSGVAQLSRREPRPAADRSLPARRRQSCTSSPISDPLPTPPRDNCWAT